MNNPLLKLAVRYMCYHLKKDESYWLTWQANIAMKIFNNYHKYFPLTTEKKSPTFHEWCNICAKEFLELLTRK